MPVFLWQKFDCNSLSMFLKWLTLIWMYFSPENPFSHCGIIQSSFLHREKKKSHKKHLKLFLLGVVCVFMWVHTVHGECCRFLCRGKAVCFLPGEKDTATLQWDGNQAEGWDERLGTNPSCLLSMQRRHISRLSGDGAVTQIMHKLGLDAPGPLQVIQALFGSTYPAFASSASLFLFPEFLPCKKCSSLISLTRVPKQLQNRWGCWAWREEWSLGAL